VGFDPRQHSSTEGWTDDLEEWEATLVELHRLDAMPEEITEVRAAPAAPATHPFFLRYALLPLAVSVGAGLAVAALAAAATLGLAERAHENFDPPIATTLDATKVITPVSIEHAPANVAEPPPPAKPATSVEQAVVSTRQPRPALNDRRKVAADNAFLRTPDF
jgi:hypothetical protein